MKYLLNKLRIIFMHTYTDVFTWIYSQAITRKKLVSFLFSVYRISCVFQAIIMYKKVQMDETSTVPGVMILILVVHIDIIKCNRTFQKCWLKKVNTPYVCATHDMELSLPPRDLGKQSESRVIHQPLQTKHCPLDGSWSLHSHACIHKIFLEV